MTSFSSPHTTYGSLFRTSREYRDATRVTEIKVNGSRVFNDTMMCTPCSNTQYTVHHYIDVENRLSMVRKGRSSSTRTTSSAEWLQLTYLTLHVYFKFR